METPTIPKGLCVSVAPYSFGAPGGVVQTELDGGPSRFAANYDRGVQQFSVTLMCSKEQFSVWNVFFLRKILKGAVTFLIDIDSGFGIEPHRANIIPGSYTVTLTSGTMYAVAFQVEAEAASTYDLTQDEVDAILEINDANDGNVHRFLDRLAIFANWDTNVLNF